MKKTHSGHRHCADLLILLVFVAVAIGAFAQQPVGALMNGMTANSKQLRQYTFKQRTETYRQNELKNTKVDEVHYNAAGERVLIPLDEKTVQVEAPRRGPGHRIVARKIEEEKEKMKEYVARLMSLTSRYVVSDASRLQAAMDTAEVTTIGHSSEIRIRMRDFVKAGDSVTMTFDSSTKRPIKTEVRTALDDGPVNIVLAFDQIREGPNYPGKMVVNSVAEQLEVRVFTYDYRL
jgi:hypothetical protein